MDFINAINFYWYIRKMCSSCQNAQNENVCTLASSPCMVEQYFSTVPFQKWLIPLSSNMGIIPNNAINIIGTPFNLLVMFNTFMVHLKCHIIMRLCIAHVLYGVVFDCVFRCSYTSIDQAVGVSPQYPDDPYYQPAEQGKRNPPLWACLLLCFPQIFSPLYYCMRFQMSIWLD